MNYKKNIALTVFTSFITLGFTQTKQLTLEDIYKNGTFASKGVFGIVSMKDGLHYTTQETKNNATYILKYEYATAKLPDTILNQSSLNIDGKKFTIDAYQINRAENYILLATQTEHIYRYSTKELYYLYAIETKTLMAIGGDEKKSYARFSPDGNKITYVKNNNLFIYDIASKNEIQITTDGGVNNIINGATDWVHEEEFAFSIAYEWNVDNTKIAYYKFDESKVKEFSFDEYNNQLYPTPYKYKYPKAGEDNSIVSIWVYDLEKAFSKKLDTGNETNIYLPRIKWTKDANVLSIVRMNRYQNKLDLLLCNILNNKTTAIYTEQSNTYIDIHEKNGDYVYFLKDKKHFIIMSERDGFNHFYHYDLTGKLIKQITKGSWDVEKLKGIDEVSNTIYYTASETTATEKDVYSISIDGTKKTKLNLTKGVNIPEFSYGMKYFINVFSDANNPSATVICNNSGKQIRVLEGNQALQQKMKEFVLSKKILFTFKTTENVELNAWMIKPPNFDASKKYPVFLIFYGGPGRNMVNNGFDGSAFFWHQYLAAKDYIIMCVDNRGTQFKGRDFKHCTYGQLGKLEVADQIETAKYLATLNYVDKSRIGTWGWSFGGYLSSLCITKGADYFKTAIAVAPVTNWRYYDNIYTERLMGLPQENPKGYDENSPINFVDKLKGNYLLIHGSGDDNVHYQNTMEMINALVKANKQFDLFIYPDRNHSIRGGNTSLHLYTKMTNFILENL